MSTDRLPTAIARHVWESKYRHHTGTPPFDLSIEDTWRRVANTLAAVEADQTGWAQRFYAILEDFQFLPGGRILAGAGSGRQVTLFNCFVMGTIEDSLDGIFEALKEGALTMQQGGGVGYDFSTLRPQGTPTHSVGAIASGPVSFMRIWDAMCATVLSTGARRGAMMATLRCDHPDIEAFVQAKQDPKELRHFNLSVLVSDAFLEAVREDREWPLVFPVVRLDERQAGKILTRRWPGFAEPVPCRVLKRVSARTLWDAIMQATYDYAEPGVLFADRLNRLNNLYYRETIAATNPCAEIPLPPYGACNLGSINLTHFVRRPFSSNAHLDLEGIAATARAAVRLLDNVIDISRYPLERQAEQARGARRIGLGLTGLADTLMMLGLHYASDAAREAAAAVMRTICHSAYRASIALAQEKGAFPFFKRESYLEGEFIRTLPADIRNAIAQYGIRNSHLIAIAPAGTISLLAGNVSSGIEPVFATQYTRRIREPDGSHTGYPVVDYAFWLWRKLQGPDAPLPPSFVDARHIAPEAHLALQAVLQPYVDNAISKTINVPENTSFAAFRKLYERAYSLGLKGCTTFRPNPVTEAVLESGSHGAADVHCCSLDREADGLWETLTQMRNRGIRRMPVVNDRGGLEGILTVDDVLELLAEGLTDLVGLVNQELKKEVRGRSARNGGAADQRS